MSELELPPIPYELVSRIRDTNGADALNAAVDYGELCARQALLMERYIIDMLVAAGHVSAAKVEEAREIAAAIRKGSNE